MISNRILSRFVQAAFILALLVVWHVAATTGAVNRLLLPAPADVFARAWTLVASGEIWYPLWITVFEYVAAIGIAVPLAIGVGYVIARSAHATEVFDPIVSALYAVPSIVLLPIFVLYFGLGSASKIALAATITTLPVMMSTIAGFRSVDRIYVRAAHSMGATHAQMLWEVLIPAAFPVILGGIRLGVIIAFLMVIGAETIASVAGVGREIATRAELFDTTGVFAYIMFALLLAAIVNGVSGYFERFSKQP